jgi:hypothetical protein
MLYGKIYDTLGPIMTWSYQPTLDLLNTPLFSRHELNPTTSARRSYEKAKAIGLAHGMHPVTVNL